MNGDRGVFVAVIVAFVAMVGGVALTVDTLRYRAAEHRADCERIVSARDDTRFMWLTTFDLFPESVQVDRLRFTLNERLPPLYCDGDNDEPLSLPSRG